MGRNHLSRSSSTTPSKISLVKYHCLPCCGISIWSKHLHLVKTMRTRREQNQRRSIASLFHHQLPSFLLPSIKHTCSHATFSSFLLLLFFCLYSLQLSSSFIFLQLSSSFIFCLYSLVFFSFLSIFHCPALSFSFLSIIFDSLMEENQWEWREENSSKKGKKGKEKKKEKKEKKMVMCPVCLHEVVEKSILNHQSHHNGKYFICRTCSVKYKSKRDMWSHQEKDNHK